MPDGSNPGAVPALLPSRDSHLAGFVIGDNGGTYGVLGENGTFSDHDYVLTKIILGNKC